MFASKDRKFEAKFIFAHDYIHGVSSRNFVCKLRIVGGVIDARATHSTALAKSIPAAAAVWENSHHPGRGRHLFSNSASLACAKSCLDEPTIKFTSSQRWRRRSGIYHSHSQNTCACCLILSSSGKVSQKLPPRRRRAASSAAASLCIRCRRGCNLPQGARVTFDKTLRLTPHRQQQLWIELKESLKRENKSVAGRQVASHAANHVVAA